MAKEKSASTPLVTVDPILEDLLREEREIEARRLQRRAAEAGSAILGLGSEAPAYETRAERVTDLTRSITHRPELNAFFRWYGTDPDHRQTKALYAARRGEFELTLSDVEDDPTYGDRALTHRFAALAHDPTARELYNYTLDKAIEQDTSEILKGIEDGSRNYAPVVIIGGGYHASVLASRIHRLTGVRPLIIDEGERLGGHFGESHLHGHFKNERNRPLGEFDEQRAGDTGSIFPIDRATVQVSDTSGQMYATNADTAFAMRTDMVLNGIPTTGVHYEGSRPKRRATQPGATRLEITDTKTGTKYSVFADVILNTRGLGKNTFGFELDDTDRDILDEETSRAKSEQDFRPRILTADEFIARCADPNIQFPLRGYKRVIVVGSNDSASMVIKQLVGAGPEHHHGVAELDRVEEIVQIGDLPRGRSARLQRSRVVYHLEQNEAPRDVRYASRITTVFDRARNLSNSTVGSQIIVNGRGGDYVGDLVIFCTGNKTKQLPKDTEPVTSPNAEQPIAFKRKNAPEYFVGPQTRLPVDSKLTERIANLGIGENAVAAFGWEPKDRELVKLLIERGVIQRREGDNIIDLDRGDDKRAVTSIPIKRGNLADFNGNGDSLYRSVQFGIDLRSTPTVPISTRVPAVDILRLGLASELESYVFDTGPNPVFERLDLDLDDTALSVLISPDGGLGQVPRGQLRVSVDQRIPSELEEAILLNPLVRTALKRLAATNGTVTELVLPVATNGRIDLGKISIKNRKVRKPTQRIARIPLSIKK